MHCGLPFLCNYNLAFDNRIYGLFSKVSIYTILIKTYVLKQPWVHQFASVKQVYAPFVNNMNNLKIKTISIMWCKTKISFFKENN